MATGIDNLTRSLSELMGELSDKELVRALRNTYRAEARRVKRVADRQVKASGWSNAARIAKTVRAKARKDMQGYIVAANPHGRPSMHLNRRGLLKPIAFWMDAGTGKNGERRTRKGEARGATEGAHFMDDAAREVPKSMARMEAELRKQVNRIIERKMRGR